MNKQLFFLLQGSNKGPQYLDHHGQTCLVMTTSVHLLLCGIHSQHDGEENMDHGKKKLYGEWQQLT